MTIEVICPKCQGKLRAPQDVAGKVVRCKRCQEKFRVGGGTTDSVDDGQMLSAMGSKIEFPSQPIPQTPSVAEAEQKSKHQLPSPAPAPAEPLVAQALPAPPAAPIIADEPIVLNDDALTSDPPPTAKPLTTDELIILDDPAPPAAPLVPPPAPVPVTRVAAPPPEIAFDFDAAEAEAAGKKGKKNKESFGIKKPEVGRGKSSSMGLYLALGGLFLVGSAVLGAGGLYWFVIRKPDVAEVKNSESAKTQPTRGSKTPPTKNDPDELPTTPTTKPATPTTKPTTPTTKPTTSPPTNSSTAPPVPTAPKPFVTARKALPVDVEHTQLRDLRVAGNNPQYVLVAANTFGGFQGSGAEDTITRYSVATKVKAGSFKVNADKLPWPRAFASDAAGELVALADSPGKISVYNFGTGTKVLDQVNNVGKPVNPAMLAFTKSKDLVVVDKNGTTSLWTLASKSPKTQGFLDQKLNAAATGCYVSEALLLTQHDHQIHFVAPATMTPGSRSVSVGTADDKVVPRGLAVQPSGKLAVAAYSLNAGKAGHKLHMIDLQKRALGGIQPLPAYAGTPTGVSWLSEELIVITFDSGASLIYDHESGQYVGYLKGTSTKIPQFHAGTLGEHWFALADPKSPKKTLLVGLDMPFDEQAGLMNEVKMAKHPVYLVPTPQGLAR